jgi:hypothetical protein
MKKFWQKTRLILLLFVLWRILLFLIAIVALVFIPRFGNSFPYVNTVLEPTKLPPWIWSFGNFDGVHYLRIAQNGYADAYYQAFFPLYPLLIRLFNIFPRDALLDTRIYVDPSFFYTAIILSNLFVFLSLLVFSKIGGKKESVWSAPLLLSFPTAFYFGAVYTESLFLLELLLFMLAVKKKNYLLAGVFSLFASATRLIGIILPLVLLIEVLKSLNKRKTKLSMKEVVRPALALILAPAGLIAYMVYSYKNFGSFFAFISAQPGFGADRSSLPIVTLPQVFYRYLKMFFAVHNAYQLFSISIEFLSAVAGLFLIIWAYKKIDFSWWLFSALVYLLPTLTGTFSSMPRYLLFSYIVLVPLIVKLPVNVRRSLVVIMTLVQVLLVILFTRGYWVA